MCFGLPGGRCSLVSNSYNCMDLFLGLCGSKPNYLGEIGTIHVLYNQIENAHFGKTLALKL